MVLSSDGNELEEPDGSGPIDRFQDSSFCEVLGRSQRRWLRHAVRESIAPVKLFVSGSVVLDNPLPYPCGIGGEGNVTCTCSGDNLDCYSVAQLELLHIISTATTGCNIILTGDFHFSDIKAMVPGTDKIYKSYYGFEENKFRPIYQLMSSGMSESTAKEGLVSDE